MKKCKGCGILLQTDDEDKIGYCKSMDQDFCMRCYQIKNFNKLPVIQLENSEFEKLLTDVGRTKKLVIWVIDVFDFEGSYIQNIEKYIKNNNVILVGNKVDLLPKSITSKKLRHWFIDSIDDEINVVDVLLTSAKKKYNVDRLLELIDEFTTGEVYIIGATNTGKSSLVNAIINSIYPGKKSAVTTSYFAGTTLSTIEIPVDDRTTIVDTPGIINSFQVTNYLEVDSLKKIIPKDEVKQRIYQLNSEQTLFISGLFRMDFVSGEKSSFAVFTSKNIDIHRTKLIKADDFYNKHLTNEPLSPPTSNELNNLPNLVSKSYKLTKGKHSFGLAGMGYIIINASSDIEICIYAPDGVLVKQRKNFE